MPRSPPAGAEAGSSESVAGEGDDVRAARDLPLEFLRDGAGLCLRFRLPAVGPYQNAAGVEHPADGRLELQGGQFIQQHGMPQLQVQARGRPPQRFRRIGVGRGAWTARDLPALLLHFGV